MEGEEKAFLNILILSASVKLPWKFSHGRNFSCVQNLYECLMKIPLNYNVKEMHKTYMNFMFRLGFCTYVIS